MITILWLIFTLLFLILGIFHFVQAKKKMPKFELPKRPGDGQGGVRVLGADIDQLTKDLANSFNTHIESLNKSNKRMNVIQGFGYVLASITALVSMCLTL